MPQAESREHRRWRLAQETARQLSVDTGMDGYAALAVVLDVDRRSRRDGQHGRTHAWCRDVERAGVAAISRTTGYAAAQLALEASVKRATRAVAAFKAEMAGTYAEMDDEFRQHPAVVELDEHLSRFYGEA